VTVWLHVLIFSASVVECRSTVAMLMIHGTRTMLGWKQSFTTSTMIQGNMSDSYSFTPVSISLCQLT